MSLNGSLIIKRSYSHGSIPANHWIGSLAAELVGVQNEHMSILPVVTRISHHPPAASTSISSSASSSATTI